ncbi:WD repeat-containing protein 43-like [Mya arenaria]|uniref:WD repeat-containing protein 43-like n=1 Tax=Mya arenaria TaxID=6604 RepID=UPI0022E6FAA4|nr:WD repeat-containing protein 43-like [Mya arenaria]
MESTTVEISPDGELAIHSSHDGTVKVWETATGSLRSEYKPSSHLSASCTCLSWNQLSKPAESPRKKRRRSGKGDVGQAIADLGLVAIGTVTGSVLLYSVVKGDLHSQLIDGHSDRVNGIVWYSESDSLYSCSSDQHIVQWEVTKGKIKHKWKADKSGVYSLCRCSSTHLLSAGRTIKLWDLETRQILKTFTGHATEVFRLLHVPVGESIEKSYFLSEAINDRLVNAWQIDTTSKDKNALAAFSLPEEPVSLQTSTPSADRPLVLVVVTKCGKALIFEHRLNGKLKKPLQPKVTVQIAGEGSNGSVPRPIQILAAYVCDVDTHKLLLVHGNSLKPTFEKVSYSTAEPELCLVREDPLKSLYKKDANVSKVKTPEVSKDMTYLVPSQLAPALPTQEPASRRKRKVSVGEMTMEQRLSAISLEKPKAGPRQPPKADTLVTLLVQGLQSRDNKLLSNVFCMRDKKLLENTVRKLPVQMVIPLVRELTSKMQGHAQSAFPHVGWLQCVLAVHTSYLMTFPEIVETLSPLYQMMDNRTSMLGRLSRLKGKVDIMLSQIKSQTVEEQGPSQEPLLQFEEESSEDEDDMEDIAIGPGASDSEDNWEDFSDEESDMETQEEVNGKG